jgi:deleted-in-malignant-brain-tumors protein 1
VCDDYWDIRDALVVCHQLGYSGAESSLRGAEYGQGIGLPIWLDDVRCDGTETRIEECAHMGWGLNNCHHAEDASVKCRKYLYLLMYCTCSWEHAFQWFS